MFLYSGLHKHLLILSLKMADPELCIWERVNSGSRSDMSGISQEVCYRMTYQFDHFLGHLCCLNYKAYSVNHSRLANGELRDQDLSICSGPTFDDRMWIW
jgi:hypothetical protein